MPDTPAPFSLESFETLGELLKFLRRRARISQRELAIAVGYSESQISRLESNRRPPDLTTLAARFAPALDLDDEPETLARLLALAAAARGEPPPHAAAAAPGPARGPQSPAAGPAPSRSANAPRHNLPLQLTNFIGRTAHLAEVERLLRAHRLLTLVGPGGTGKTRLALQVAAAMLDEFPDGAWLVDLAPSTQAFQVPQAVAQALGLRAESAELAEPTPVDHPVRDALSASLDHLRDKNLLLILDNCEHLIEACAQLAEQLLRAAPGLRILATSREALAIAGEMSYPVPALSLPDPGQLPALEAVAQTEAVRLFVERAQAVRPDFALTDENVQTVVQICQRLDGIPLALELAAARTRALTVEQIAAHLDDRFRLLTGGNRSAPQRQQTLRGTIDWSYDLLPPAEQSGLRRLAVFAGGWTLEAAEVVCSSTYAMAAELAPLGSGGAGGKDHIAPAPLPPSALAGLSAADILDLLAQLVAKSLVLSEQQPGMGARFSLLETIRQYAHEKLIEAGESESAHDRHLAYYLALAEEAAPALRGSGQAQWVSRLRRDNDNFRAAQAWAIQTENAPAALRLAGALTYFWRIRGYAAEGRRRLEAALALQASHGVLPASAALARVLLEAGRIDMEQDPAISQARLEQARDIYQTLGDRSGAANALYWLAEQRVMAHKSYAPALPLYQSALALWAAAGDEWGIGVADHRLGHAAEEAGERAQARALYERSLQTLGQVGDGWQLLGPRRDLARLAWAEGDIARARDMFEKNLAAYEELGSRGGMVDALSNLAALSMAQGNYAQASAEAQTMQTLPGSQRNIAAGRMRQGQVDYLQGHLEPAQAHFEASLEIFRALNDQNGLGWTPPWLGCVAYRAGDFDRARALIDAGLAIDDPDGYWPELAFALLSRGDVDRAQNDAAAAAHHYARSLRIVMDHFDQPDVADRLEGFAKLAAAERPERAARLFGAAEALRARLGTPLSAIERPGYDSALMQTIRQIDPPAFDAAWAEGQAFTWEQAAAYALEA